MHGDTFNNQLLNSMKVIEGSSARSNKRDRLYDGQLHTTSGERGKTEVKGITLRDLRDCFTKAVLICCGNEQQELRDLVKNDDWIWDDLYRVDFNRLDPIAIAKGITCEVEKMMGIYPNVPELIYEPSNE